MISTIDEDDAFISEYETWIDYMAEKQPLWQEETYAHEYNYTIKKTFIETRNRENATHVYE